MDPFFWMRDRSKPEIIEYLKTENEYTERMMKHTLEIREKLLAELKGRMRENDMSVPYLDGDYSYYHRWEAGRQYEIFCRRHISSDAPEEILLDCNQIALEQNYCELGTFKVSPDHRWLAYTIDTKGNERYWLHFRNLETGKDLSYHIENVHSRIQWANDSRTVLYVGLDETVRPFCLYRHTLGDALMNDVVIHEETDPAFRMMVTRSRSRRIIFMRLESQITTEVWYLDADRPMEPFQLIHPRQEGLEYYMLHREKEFIILTNDEAGNFRIMTAPIDSPGRDNWKEMISHRDNALIEDVEIFKNHLVLFERIDGLNTIRIINLVTDESHYIDFEEKRYSCRSGRNPQYDTTVFRFVFTSLITPETVVAYDMNSRERELLKVEELVGGYNSSDYTTEHLYATAQDGTQVPISLVYRNGLVKDGTAPLLLYGYGAYGESLEPEFWSPRLSLLDRGFIFAMAHVRGGSEYGREWYEDGKLLSKKNTFTDFIACAEHLIAEKYTSSDNLIIEGTSAGGLLIGTVVNMRPDLFQAAIADVPFVDVVNTMTDQSIPRTATEFDEWGNPVDDKEVRAYMKSYSPYDNVARKSYPNMLITTGINDPRVRFWEPAKWAAKLRALKTDDNLLLLRIDFRGGHFGPSGRFDYLKAFAFNMAFMFDVLGIEA